MSCPNCEGNKGKSVWQMQACLSHCSSLPEVETVEQLRARIAALEALASEQREALYDCYHTLQNTETDEPEWRKGSMDLAAKALSLTQSHPRILAIGKVLGAAKGLSEAVNRDVDYADWNDRVYEAGTRLDVALAEYEASK